MGDYPLSGSIGPHPRPDPGHVSSGTTTTWTTSELRIPSVAHPLHCQETMRVGGTQMEVHLEAKCNSFAAKRIDFPLISNCSQDTLLVFASYPRTEKIIHLLAGFMLEFMRSGIWWVFRVWGPAASCGQRQCTILVKAEKKNMPVLL